MRLDSVKLENYKSISDETLVVEPINDSFTYSLIGINESGKSSILKAISLKDGLETILLHDFHDVSRPICMRFSYSLSSEEIDNIKNMLGLDEALLGEIKLEKTTLIVIYNPGTTEPVKEILFELKRDTVDEYTLADGSPRAKNEGEDTAESFNLKQYINEKLKDHLFNSSHRVVFWKSEPRYLITDPINLTEFAQNPDGVSVPLRNCFELSGFSDIQGKVNQINANQSESRNFIDKLEDDVTKHIKNIWPDHKIKIKFHLDNLNLTFLIEDEGVKYNNKTTGQRSDGFRQFISFLLTISAEKQNNKLTNTLLILDEPETHLHPKGQEHLRDELKKISEGDLNNIVIFATHSNYMIDRNCLGRCLRVVKEGNKETKIEKIDGENSSYSEINYLVFDVPTNDYHNELFGYLEDIAKSKLNSLDKDRKWKNEKSGKEEDVSLPTFIRHSIHHPENTSNAKFTQEELVESIKILRKLKYGND